jgi:PPIC-type PPIASE domain
MRSRNLIPFAAACALLAACDGLKEALTAHVDVVARAASQELSVTRLSDLIGNAKIQVPVTRENVALVADIWSGYQQVAFAAAHGDSLADPKVIDAATASYVNSQRLQRFMEQVSKSFKVDSGNEAAYNQAAGGLLGARHILFKFPVPATDAQKDSVRKRAEAIRPQITSANFTAMAKKYSGDPGVAQNNGNYGVFPRAQMVPEFSNGTAALKPGEISAPVASTYGYHIIQRLTYAEAKDDFATKYARASGFAAESTYFAQMEAGAGIEVKDKAIAALKTAVAAQPQHRNDNTTLATFKGGELTIAKLLGWLESSPGGAQIAPQIAAASDSELKPFVKSMVDREILLKRADSAKVEISADERTKMHDGFKQLVTQVWQALGVDPAQLADSAKSAPERERLAAARIESFLDRVMAGQAQAAPVPAPLKRVLDGKYEASVNTAGVDRAFTNAQRVRAVADSTRAASQPKSEVPLPGGAAPQPTAPPASTKKP